MERACPILALAVTAVGLFRLFQVSTVIQGTDLLLRPGRGVEYCDQPVCLCVCAPMCLSVSKHISGILGPIGTKFCVWILCGRGSVLLWRRCDTLCTSGFMDDVTFGRNGRDTERWRLTRAATTMNGAAIQLFQIAAVRRIQRHTGLMHHF